jgi:hypothetical protein
MLISAVTSNVPMGLLGILKEGFSKGREILQGGWKSMSARNQCVLPEIVRAGSIGPPLFSLLHD